MSKKRPREIRRPSEEGGTRCISEPSLSLGIIKMDVRERKMKQPGPAEHRWIDGEELNIIQAAAYNGPKLYEKPKSAQYNKLMAQLNKLYGG